MKYKYLLIHNDTPTLHTTIKDVSTIINKHHTSLSKLLKKNHFISIEQYTIYRLNWQPPKQPIIVTFD